mmetsp:Transcript_4926/g.16435  ORF Transcript_4926/g.16435 Transcript_4926/m.16435 type:complete len:228 (-) Transcript_4926:124-807(-)
MATRQCSRWSPLAGARGTSPPRSAATCASRATTPSSGWAPPPSGASAAPASSPTTRCSSRRRRAGPLAARWTPTRWRTRPTSTAPAPSRGTCPRSTPAGPCRSRSASWTTGTWASAAGCPCTAPGWTGTTAPPRASTHEPDSLLGPQLLRGRAPSTMRSFMGVRSRAELLAMEELHPGAGRLGLRYGHSSMLHECDEGDEGHACMGIQFRGEAARKATCLAWRTLSR